MKLHGLFFSAALSVIWLAPIGDANAMTLREAISAAMTTNPEVMQALENREAVEFELRQAKSLFMPTVDLETSLGASRLDNPSRRRLGAESDELYPAEVGLSVNYTIFDGGRRQAELERQAARVDGASFRVRERSEIIALKVVQEYLEILLQGEVVKSTEENLRVLQGVAGDIGQIAEGGAVAATDGLQANERILAAKARLKEAREDYKEANIRFQKLVGQEIGKASFPSSSRNLVPASIDVAIANSLGQNPSLAAVSADVDAADATVRAMPSHLVPTVGLQGRAYVGDDIDGSEGNNHGWEAKVVARWKIFDGGLDAAKKQERIRRAGEQRFAKQQAQREVEESIRSAWNRRQMRSELASTLKQQASTNAQLVSGYREQFRVGQRSLLDVLDAQNTRYNVTILSKTAAYAAAFEDYRILAAMGTLSTSMGATPAAQASAYARNEFNVVSQSNPMYKRQSSRQVKGMPLDLLSPIE